MMTTRRGFFKILAKGAMAATAIGILPVSALPAQGYLHDAIVENCYTRAARALAEFQASNETWRIRGVCGEAFFDQLALDLIGDGPDITKHWDTVIIRGVRVRAAAGEPMWSIRFEEGHWRA